MIQSSSDTSGKTEEYRSVVKEGFSLVTQQSCQWPQGGDHWLWEVQTKATTSSNRGLRLKLCLSRYLGWLWLDNELNWTTHTRHLYKKAHLNKGNWIFWKQSLVASVIFMSVVCLGRHHKERRCQRGWSERGGSVISMKLDPLTVAEKRTSARSGWCQSPSALSNQRSSLGDRLLLPKCDTTRLKNSAVPRVSTLFNSLRGRRRTRHRRMKRSSRVRQDIGQKQHKSQLQW